MNYSVLAYYAITTIDDPFVEAKRHKEFLQTLDSRGRIYIATQGVNAQLSLATKDLEVYRNWLASDPRMKDIDIKIHKHREHAFHKLTVKMRKELVAVGLPIDFSKTGEHISPQEWEKKIDAHDPHTIVIDVRNHYESKVGYFEGAILPNVDTFRKFPEYAEELAKKYDPEKTTVLMYCTGGIRCEFYSPLLKEKGFSKIYQLRGGVIRYGLEEKGKYWKGKLFVFDDRLVVPINEEKKEVLALCQFCQKEADTYYNCANMDCNDLFIACPDCIEKEKGCCSKICLEHGRVRAFESRTNPKPFRKLSKEEKEKIKEMPSKGHSSI